MDDYDALELRLIAHLFNQPGHKTSLPTLGEYCKTKLGVDMKHRLVKFVDKRPGAFARDHDVRQQVWCVLEGREDVEAYVKGRLARGPGLPGSMPCWRVWRGQAARVACRARSRFPTALGQSSGTILTFPFSNEEGPHLDPDGSAKRFNFNWISVAR